MRNRPAARILLINPSDEVLLFRFRHSVDALAGKSYWATPGGGLEPGETFHQAAIRELWEETGILRQRIGGPVAERRFTLLLANGEQVAAQERFFVARVSGNDISHEHWSGHEKAVIGEHHWWSMPALRRTAEVVYPENLPDMLAPILAGKQDEFSVGWPGV